ncbi:MAG: HAMP domain-containing histidine kinase, partial [Lachnospiraceae bacterium]|nr:HAMP domain-containing histidine kinase [Lachnospiraceae bacterium]
MSMETINSIFKSAFTTKETGSGFGLVIAKHILELHNGNLLCDSTLNKGTTFTIQLPF